MIHKQLSVWIFETDLKEYETNQRSLEQDGLDYTRQTAASSFVLFVLAIETHRPRRPGLDWVVRRRRFGWLNGRAIHDDRFETERETLASAESLSAISLRS